MILISLYGEITLLTGMRVCGLLFFSLSKLHPLENTQRIQSATSLVVSEKRVKGTMNVSVQTVVVCSVQQAMN